jgi:hypothetical protein
MVMFKALYTFSLYQARRTAASGQDGTRAPMNTRSRLNGYPYAVPAAFESIQRPGRRLSTAPYWSRVRSSTAEWFAGARDGHSIFRSRLHACSISAPIDPEIPDAVSARVMASLQVEFEREFRIARRDRTQARRDRTQRMDKRPERVDRADEA